MAHRYQFYNNFQQSPQPLYKQQSFRMQPDHLIRTVTTSKILQEQRAAEEKAKAAMPPYGFFFNFFLIFLHFSFMTMDFMGFRVNHRWGWLRKKSGRFRSVGLQIFLLIWFRVGKSPGLG
ncbi:unnamed protein product [Meloidogyne enterolobii]|uniref:Uncharacterized protein n=1 Tax=Meloidogyne enterolobii TaxID=390850 RepID=A0ACB0YJE3_MELEN